MSTKKSIFLIRHGQTDFNKMGIIQGSGIDSELNETGWNQARMFYRSYGHIAFDAVYTSRLRRTHQSVFPFLEQGIVHHQLEELNEINWGIMEGMRSTPQLQDDFNRLVQSWRRGALHELVENGESPENLFERQKRGLEHILSRAHERRILICSHGRAMRSFLCLLTGTPLERMDDFGHSNLCLYVLEQRPDRRFEIVMENSTEHLQP